MRFIRYFHKILQITAWYHEIGVTSYDSQEISVITSEFTRTFSYILKFCHPGCSYVKHCYLEKEYIHDKQHVILEWVNPSHDHRRGKDAHTHTHTHTQTHIGDSEIVGNTKYLSK